MSPQIPKRVSLVQPVDESYTIDWLILNIQENQNRLITQLFCYLESEIQERPKFWGWSWKINDRKTFLIPLDTFLLPMHVLIVMNSIKLVTCFFLSNYEPYGTNALVGFQLWTLHFSKAKLDLRGS